MDIIASRGSPEPDWLLCMGYVYIRSTPSTLEFLPRFIKRLIDVKDDQRAFNLVLKYGLHLTWNKVGCLCLCHVEEVRPARSLAALPSLGARRECTAKQAQGGAGRGRSYSSGTIGGWWSAGGRRLLHRLPPIPNDTPAQGSLT